MDQPLSNLNVDDMEDIENHYNDKGKTNITGYINESAKYQKIEASPFNRTSKDFGFNTSVEVNESAFDEEGVQEVDIEVETPGINYRYINIEAENIDYDDIENASIRFDVNSSWIEENNIDRGNVKLHRYIGGSWEELETTEISSENGKIVYQAETPGFSYFAVSGEEIDEEEVEEEEEPEDPVDEEDDEEEDEEIEEEYVPETGIGNIIIPLILVLAIAGIFYYVYRKKQNDSN